MIERSEHPRLTLEAGPPFWVGVEHRGRILIATSRPSLVSWARKTSPIPPDPSCDHAVRADLPADQIARGLSRKRRPRKSVRRVVRQQRLTSLQLNVSRTGVEQKRVAGVRIVPSAW